MTAGVKPATLTLMTTNTQTIDKKIAKIIDSARHNGWEVDVTDSPDSVIVKAIDPNPQQDYYGVIVVGFWRDAMTDKWKFDFAEAHIKGRSEGSFKRKDSKTLTAAGEIIAGTMSPKARAEKVVKEVAAAARRDAAKQAYAEQPDTPLRRDLRRNLEAAAKVTVDQDKYKAKAKEDLAYATHWYLEEALAERAYANLAAQALSWEGNVDRDGHVTSLEEAATRTADGALMRVLSDAKRGMNRSSSGMANAEEDMANAGAVRFVSTFHPIYSTSFTVGWHRNDAKVVLDLNWLGGGHI